jgi:uncharacterized protein (TIGR03790 family)
MHGCSSRLFPNCAVALAAALLLPAVAAAGGSGLNVAVIVNQASSNSVELGNYYCEQRGVPPENLLRIHWPGDNVSWTRTDYEARLLNPFLTAFEARGLSRQIQYVVLSMDIPFTVTEDGKFTSTTSALFYGFKSDTKSNDNSYAFSEGAFGEVFPATAPGRSFLTTMVTAGSLAQAKRLVDQGVHSDGTHPIRPVVLMKTSDLLRNIRYPRFDEAVFSTLVAGLDLLHRTNSDSTLGYSNLLGLQTGLANFSLSPNTFGPGAMADSMTSFGGVIFGPNGQTSLLSFIHAGASGSYGTVAEPGAIASKFPDPMTYFYQTRGFSLAECYYQSIRSPYLGLIVAEPLAAPFQRPGTAVWLSPAANAILNGTVQATVRVQAHDAAHPIQCLDLFVDGKFNQTLTNLAPTPGNRLELSFLGPSVVHTVEQGATLGSTAQALATLVNQTAALRGARVSALTRGDRIEIRSLAGQRPLVPGALRVVPTGGQNGPGAPDMQAFVRSAAGTAPMQTTYLVASRDSCLDSPAHGRKAWRLSGVVDTNSWLQLSVTKVNGQNVTVRLNNQSGHTTLDDLATEFYQLINATPALQTGDGVSAEDLTLESFSDLWLSLVARAPGHAASGVRAQLTASAGVLISPSGEQELRENLSDLEPRNHVYVCAGLTELELTFPLDTRGLSDGWHELTVVAYEGSHTRTQTRASVPVQVRNTLLQASLSVEGHPDQALVQDTLNLQVNATMPASMIRLFSSGGQLASATNQASATFSMPGSSLGIGLHPFWAEVETSGGQRYRTETSWRRLVGAP